MNLPGVDDLAKYLIKDMDEKEQNAVGTLRDRKLLEHCDSLYVVSERQTEAFAPLIILRKKAAISNLPTACLQILRRKDCAPGSGHSRKE